MRRPGAALVFSRVIRNKAAPGRRTPRADALTKQLVSFTISQSMELEIGLTLLLLIVLSVLATVDMAFAQLSDVGLRRLITENGDKPRSGSRVFLEQILENRPRFSFALSAMIQILLVIVAVLVTSISLTLFPEPRLVLVGLAAGLVLAGIFRQLVPLFISTRNPEATLLLLLPIVRPFFPLMAVVADPFQRLFDRSKRKEHVTDIGT